MSAEVWTDDDPLRLTEEEADALWHDSQDDVDHLGRYWEHPVFAALIERLGEWYKYESPL